MIQTRSNRTQLEEPAVGVRLSIETGTGCDNIFLKNLAIETACRVVRFAVMCDRIKPAHRWPRVTGLDYP